MNERGERTRAHLPPRLPFTRKRKPDRVYDEAWERGYEIGYAEGHDQGHEDGVAEERRRRYLQS